jgi:hypothetical protein
MTSAVLYFLFVFLFALAERKKKHRYNGKYLAAAGKKVFACDTA